MEVELDQVEREFMGSSMEDLKVRRMSASDEAEARRMRSEKVRERKRVDLVVLAIGKQNTRMERGWSINSFLGVHSLL